MPPSCSSLNPIHPSRCAPPFLQNSRVGQATVSVLEYIRRHQARIGRTLDDVSCSSSLRARGHYCFRVGAAQPCSMLLRTGLASPIRAGFVSNADRWIGCRDITWRMAALACPSACSGASWAVPSTLDPASTPEGQGFLSSERHWPAQDVTCICPSTRTTAGSFLPDTS